MRPGLFVDSWGWIVLANRNEAGFLQVSEFYREQVASGTSLITTDYLLDEVITFLFAKTAQQLSVRYLQALLGSIEGGKIRIERIGPDRFEKAWRMRLKYGDHRDISFTDFTSFIVMQELSLSNVLTNDRHFEQVNLGFQRVPSSLTGSNS